MESSLSERNYPIVAPPQRARHLATVDATVAARVADNMDRVSYNGGPLIRNATLTVFYWGSAWSTQTTLALLRGQMDRFLSDFISGEAMDQLTEYSRPGYPIGRGMFLSSGIVGTDIEPSPFVTDAQIQTALKKWIVDFSLPVDANSLLLVYLPPNVIVQAFGQQSCMGFCGYHSDIGEQIYYAVVPYPCSDCQNGLTVFESLTVISSHEICEAVTDPVFMKGWYDPTDDEIGDLCNLQTKTVGGYLIQQEWSNQNGACI